MIAGVSRLREGAHYNYSTLGHTLLVATVHPPSEDIRMLEFGDASFALVIRDGIVFMLAKLGDRPWCASHYNWWINPPFLRPEPLNDLQNIEAGISLQTCLADASTGLVVAARSFNLSSDFGRTLLETVVTQIRFGLDPWHQLEVAEQLLNRSPDLDWLLGEAVCLQLCQPEEKQVGLTVAEYGLA